MDLTNHLSQQLEQKQTLAPQQLASLSLLTVPVMELENRIAEEMAQNPVLELVENEPAQDSELPPEDLSLPQDSDFASEEPDMLDSNREDFEEHLDRVLESGDPGEYSDDADSRRQFMFDSIVAETSLQETLLEQLRFAEVPDRLRSCAEYVIGSLDENGYFRGTLPDAAQAAAASMEEAEKALKLVQSFDPPGIAARDLRECLLLQVARLAHPDSRLTVLIRDHLDELAHNKLPQIAAGMEIGMDELNHLIAQLRQLNPHP